MDSAFTVPGLGIRFGMDAILGLIPGIGDAATSLVSAYIINRAYRLGASRATLARMTINFLVDLIVGALPLAGDAFDVYWKANQRNVDLLRRHALAEGAQAKKLRQSDRVFVAVVLAVLAALVVASVVVTYFVVVWLGSVFARAWG